VCKPVDADDVSDSVQAGKWDLATEGDKALGVVDDPLTPQIEGDVADYLEPTAYDLVEPDFDQAGWS
jgi:hypothetical protein